MTATARLGLTRDLTTDNYDVGRVNANSDKIDAAIGAPTCLSSARPSSGNFDGRLAYETDTTASIIYIGSISNWRYLTRPTIASVTARNAMTNKYEGLQIYRADRDWIEIWDGVVWRVHGMAVCASEADRDGSTGVTNPYNGAKALTTDYMIEWTHYNSVWHALPGQIAARLRQTVFQPTAASTFVPITFTTEDLDTHGGHSTVTNTSRFQVPIAGRYRFTGAVAWVANDFGQRATAWAKNGVRQPGTLSNDEAVSGTKEIQVVARPWLVTLAAADYVELLGYQDIGTLNTSVASDAQSTMEVEFLGS